MRKLRNASIAAIFAVLSGEVAGWQCDVWFFDPADHFNQHPLPQAHSAFADSMRRANQNVAEEQRNVAISYETGYMVTRCPEMALFWYKKAAAAGDEIAKTWMKRHDRQACLRSGKESWALPSNYYQRCDPDSSGGGH